MRPCRQVQLIPKVLCDLWVLFRRAVAQLSGKRRGESWSLAGSSAFIPVRCGKNIVAGLFQDWVVVYVRLSILL